VREAAALAGVVGTRLPLRSTMPSRLLIRSPPMSFKPCSELIALMIGACLRGVQLQQLRDRSRSGCKGNLFNWLDATVTVRTKVLCCGCYARELRPLCKRCTCFALMCMSVCNCMPGV
jgi:hypothetical protein